MADQKGILTVQHPEVSIDTLSNPDHNRKPGQVGIGESTLVIHNLSPNQERTYSVSIEAVDKETWRKEWFKLNPQASLITIAKAVTQEDDFKVLHVPISQGGTRNVVVDFDIPSSPAARAGVYDIAVHTRLSGRSVKGTEIDEQSEVIKAIIRPYYRWTIKPVAASKVARWCWRSANFQFSIVNQGNDWLYVKIRSQEVVGLRVNWPGEEQETVIAIPPPDVDQESCSRKVTINVTAQIAFWEAIRGDIKWLPLPLTFTRVHAPSVPPLPKGTEGDGKAMAGIREAVTVLPCEDPQPTIPFLMPSLEFRPLIPKRWKDFVAFLKRCFTWVVGNIKQIVMGMIGLIIAWQLVGVVIVSYFQQSGPHISQGQIETLSSPIRITAGSWFLMSDVEVYYYDSDKKVKLDVKRIGELRQPVWEARFPADPKKNPVKIYAEYRLLGSLLAKLAAEPTKGADIAIGNKPQQSQTQETVPLTVSSGGQWIFGPTDRTTTMYLDGKFADNATPKIIGANGIECTYDKEKHSVRLTRKGDAPTEQQTIRITFPLNLENKIPVATIEVRPKEQPVVNPNVQSSSSETTDSDISTGSKSNTGVPPQYPDPSEPKKTQAAQELESLYNESDGNKIVDKMQDWLTTRGYDFLLTGDAELGSKDFNKVKNSVDDLLERGLIFAAAAKVQNELRSPEVRWTNRNKLANWGSNTLEKWESDKLGGKPPSPQVQAIKDECKSFLPKE